MYVQNLNSAVLPNLDKLIAVSKTVLMRTAAHRQRDDYRRNSVGRKKNRLIFHLLPNVTGEPRRRLAGLVRQHEA